MRYTPHPYQSRAMDFLRSHDRGALFLGLGLGKTVITLTVAQEYLNDSFRVNRFLVVAPLLVAQDTWSREADKWDHLTELRISRILGTAKQREAAYRADADVYVINRENVVWLIEEHGKDWKFDGLIIDELSSFKSPGAKRWRMLRRVTKLCTVVWGLTGTPASNGYGDLYAEMFLLDGGARLGKTLTEFRTRFFDPGARKGHIVYEWRLKRGAKERIDALLGDLCLSMSAEDYLTLPERIDVDHTVEMTAAERRLYDQFERDRILPLLRGQLAEDVEQADHAVVGATAAALSGKLLQLANGAVYDEEGGVFHVHDRKLDALEEIVEAAQGEPILCFYEYRHDLTRIRERFPQARTMDEPDAIAKWNRGETALLLAHPASVAYGLNLQDGGHHIVWFGCPWSLELWEQANGRLHRQGQKSTVIVHRILTKDTLDGRVMKALEQKNTTQQSLLNALRDYGEERTP